MEKTFKAVSFKPTGEIFPVTLNRNKWFDKAKSMLGIETADIVTRTIKGVKFDILCDDEGLLVDKPIFSLVDSENYILLVGNLLLMHPMKRDEYGNEIMQDITKEDEQAIMDSIRMYRDNETGNIRLVLTGGDYEC